MATTELAIESCNSMRCPSQHHHGHEGCCKTIPAMHVDVGQPSAFQGVNHFPVVLELPTLLSEACRSEPERIVAELSHAPPIFCSRLLTTRTPSSYLARPPAARWDHHLCWRNVVRFRELFCDCRGRCLSLSFFSLCASIASGQGAAPRRGSEQSGLLNGKASFLL